MEAAMPTTTLPIYNSEDGQFELQGESTENLPDFEFFGQEVTRKDETVQVSQKSRADVSHILLLYSKRIQVLKYHFWG